MSSLQKEQLLAVFKPEILETVSQEEIELLENWIEEILFLLNQNIESK